MLKGQGKVARVINVLHGSTSFVLIQLAQDVVFRVTRRTSVSLQPPSSSFSTPKEDVIDGRDHPTPRSQSFARWQVIGQPCTPQDRLIGHCLHILA